MTISATTQGLRPGVCLSTAKPSNPFDGQVIYMTDVDQTAVWDGTTWTVVAPIAGGRNKIINGDMRIAQRGTATITGSGSAQYPVDRWSVFNGTGTVTFVQSTDAPAGFNYSILATVTATGSYSTAGYTQVTHKIEGFNCQDLAYGTASAKTIVLSFWSKSSVVGTQNVSFKNSGNNRVYVATYTIDVANTWEKKTVTVVGDTTGTWLVNSGIGLEVTFNLGMGTQYDATAGSWQALAARYSTSDAIDFAANSGATWRVTGVQLETGAVATPFEIENYGITLAKCQRYYWRISGATAPNVGLAVGGGTSGSTPAARRMVIPLPVSMRAIPTPAISGNHALYNVGLSNRIITAVGFNSSAPDILSLDVNSSVGTVLGEFLFWVIDSSNATDFLEASAEL